MNVLKLFCYGTALAALTALPGCQSPVLEEEIGKSDPQLDRNKTGLLGVASTTTPFTRVFKGIEYAAATDNYPRLQRAFALRIDLKNTNLQVLATPSNGTAGGETTLQTTPTFLDAHNLKAAINANFFTASGSAANNEGLVISNGTVVSNAQSGTFSSQLTFTSGKIANLLSSSSNPVGIYNAVGGAEIILKDGVNLGTNPDVQPRTVMGLSQDKRYLIMVVIDGRQPGWSEGVNHAEAANWLKYFGAYDGAVFDGGGSSCLVRDNGSGSPQLLNRPSDGSARAVSANLGVYSQPLYKHVTSDFNANWTVEQSLYRTSNNFFYVYPSSGVTLGLSGDIPVLADFDNDGSSNRTVWRPSNGNWYVMNAATTSFSTIQWGVNGDIPVPADYNGDGTAERALYRPSNGTWYYKNGVTGATSSSVWGRTTDIPVVGDYDGDNKADQALYRPSDGYWYVTNSTNNTVTSTQWGAAGDIPIPADYDGNGVVDIAIYRPSTGEFKVRGILNLVLGGSGDIPVPADYNGDGKAECAVYRPSNTTWYIQGQSPIIYGVVGDIPLILPYAIRKFFF